MGLDALKGIQHTLRSPGGQQTALLVFGVCSLLLLLLLVQVFLGQWKRRRRLTERWRGFARAMVREHLTPPQRALLTEMARKEVPEDPINALQKAEVFERAVHRHLKPLIMYEGPHTVEEAGRLISSLREALGFSRVQGRHYYSTRELQEGQQVELYAAGLADFPVGNARVGEQREDYLDLVDVQCDEPLTGRMAQAVFYSRGRRFEFESELLHVDLPHARCRLAHTIDVRAADSRQCFRVESDAPLRFRAQWEPPDAWRDAVLRNLSVGGAALVSGFYYATGETLAIQVQPAQYAAAESLEEDEELGAREIAAKVLETRKLSEERCLYRVEFHDALPEDRRYLTRLVQMLQLHPRPAGA